MFDKYYSYRSCGNRQANPDDLFLKDHLFSFNCRHNHQYIVHVEEYDFQLFILKFHLKNHSDSPKKYQIESKLFDMPRVLKTCLNITIDEFYKKNQKASFGFVGAYSDGESPENTKRFRVYQKIMGNLFSPLAFEHHKYLKNSAYLLINKLAKQHEPQLLNGIENLFGQVYHFENINT